eukprot:NODE_2664_length_524_cov_36.566751_g2614_i0.p1 GENE.NODE_2664_length_524_cov_36.566751_g2614_i0~~NODE_2664_length_524_cov_36.566751_g2614_i0.p1  ORF type:complete len:128 (-),score=15.64 NODE_2664_length_524_cov_36.566751_g2614_i0:63-446(-)
MEIESISTADSFELVDDQDVASADIVSISSTTTEVVDVSSTSSRSHVARSNVGTGNVTLALGVLPQPSLDLQRSVARQTASQIRSQHPRRQQQPPHSQAHQLRRQFNAPRRGQGYYSNQKARKSNPF